MKRKKKSMKRILLLLIFFVITSVFFMNMPGESWDLEKDVRELFSAIEKGDVAEVEKFVNREAHVYAKTAEGDTALMVAVKNNKIPTTKKIPVINELLIQNRDRNDLNIQNNNKQTALTLAIETNDLDIVKALLSYGLPVDFNLKDNNDKNPLMLAVEKGNTKVIEEILNQVPEEDIIDKTINFANTDEVTKILSNKKNEILELLNKGKNQYILYFKIKQTTSNSNVSDIKNFINEKPIISFNITNIDRNPLAMAIAVNNLELVNFLIEKGTNVNQAFARPHFQGVTHLMDAVLLAHKEFLAHKKKVSNIPIIKTLLQRGANPNAKIINIAQKNVFTPFSLVLTHPEATKLVELFIQFNADINYKIVVDGKTITPLMVAVEIKNIDIIPKLLEAGADPSIPDQNGETALDVVKKKLNTDLSPSEEEQYKKIFEILQKAEKSAKKIKPTTPPQKTNQLLLTSLQNLTQKLKILQTMLTK